MNKIIILISMVAILAGFSFMAEPNVSEASFNIGINLNFGGYNNGYSSYGSDYGYNPYGSYGYGSYYTYPSYGYNPVFSNNCGCDGWGYSSPSYYSTISPTHSYYGYPSYGYSSYGSGYGYSNYYSY